MKRLFRSRCFCFVTLSLSLLANTFGWCADKDTATDKPLIKTTHVYKTVGDVKVEADVHRPEGAEARPVVVWILKAGFGDAVKVP